MTKTIEDYAKAGEQCDVMQALKLLTKAYMDMCGISLGYRTALYCAAEAWLERLAWMDLPLSEMARKEPLVCVMQHITSEYDPERYDGYDITGMDDEDLRSCFKEMANEGFDETTLEVLAWGLLEVMKKEKLGPLSVEVEASAPDGTYLKGILWEQGCAWIAMIMEVPYENVSICKSELVRDAKELLVAGYEDWQRLHKMEPEIRALYPLYQEKLGMCDPESTYMKKRVFDEVYGELIGDCTLVSLENLLNEWLGLEFFTIL